MPSVSSPVLVDALINAFQDSGSSAILLSGVRRRPLRFLVRTAPGGVEVWVYVWTLTHGGRASLPDEYRIQMTTVKSPLPENPSGHTLLLGYEPDTEVFAGFDLARHGEFTTGSPSVQIDVNCLHQALQDGIAFDRKTNQEIVVGVRSDQLLNYMVNARELHRQGGNANVCVLLQKASALEDVTEREMRTLGPKRRKIVALVSRWMRAASFRRQVLCAYDNRCAVTRMQLKLVDAAHILPVHAEGASDNVRNGIALSPTYHRAFDDGLIYLDEKYVMRINEEREKRLAGIALDGGIGRFKSVLGRAIHLPHDRRQRPDVSMIRRANRCRLISGTRRPC